MADGGGGSDVDGTGCDDGGGGGGWPMGTGRRGARMIGAPSNVGGAAWTMWPEALTAASGGGGPASSIALSAQKNTIITVLSRVSFSLLT